MILGVGTDLCRSSRWERMLERYGDRAALKILHGEEAAYLLAGNRSRLPERLAGRWALREAFGKALGLGLAGWSWKHLRYLNGRLWAEDDLATLLKSRGIERIHASISHEAGLALAVVILEGSEANVPSNPEP